jgi:flotillin
MEVMAVGLASVVGLVVLFGVPLLMSLMFRRVVSTNEVHIVQSSKKTTSYGKDTGNGNTYYKWPSWLPIIGVTTIKLPVSVFDLDLVAYEAYDKGRLPFVVDVKAFFRITDSNVAAQRITSFSELEAQLKAIVQGAVRTVLASNEIEEIMQGRSKFGHEFTQEVTEQLASWGVGTVKNIELMDIRDGKESKVIHNIMDKKKSHIEMESRQEVAKNMKMAQISEIEAKREVETQQQVALQTVGLRKVETERQIAISEQEKEQVIQEQTKTTQEKRMAVLEVERVRAAEIAKKVKVVEAEQDKQTNVLIADGKLEAKKREAEGVTVEGTARAAAEKAMQLAPVEAQITLAKEIGSNEPYQRYLITIRQVEAQQQVGIEQAKALEKAGIKIIANSGSITEGVSKIGELLGSSGGMKLAAMVEGLATTDFGKKIVEKIV